MLAKWERELEALLYTVRPPHHFISGLDALIKIKSSAASLIRVEAAVCTLVLVEIL